MPASGVLITCQRCGLQWHDGDYGRRFIGGDNSRGIRIANVGMNCPRCGGSARLADGTYDIRDGRWHLVRRLADDLKSAHASSDDYALLLTLLRQAQAAGKESDEIADDLAAQTPFTLVAETIKAHPTAVGTIIGILVALVLWLIPSPSGTAMAPADSGHTPGPAISLQHLSSSQLDELAEEIAQQLRDDHAQLAPVPPAQQRVKGSERNLPCRCGSGRKAKKCCSNPTNAP